MVEDLRRVDPDSVQRALDNASAGQVIQLSPRRYTKPLRLVGRRGDRARPITIRGGPGVVLDGGIPFAVFNNRANLVARADCLRGRGYPGIQAIATEAFLTIDSSDHVVVEDLSIRGAWPTAVFVDTSASVRLSRIHVRESSFAFFLHGERTSDITICHCRWLQDVNRGDIWRRIPWKYIHSETFSDGDARAFDGDFIRSYRIRGRLHVHHNWIEHCFNGIQCFNRRDYRDATLNSDVVIHDNVFRYVRDNVIEPEVEAHNWWVFRNRIFNCHAPFSLEMERSSNFYIFENTYWFDEQQGVPDTDKNRGGCFFKLGSEGPPPSEVTHYFFNNSLFLRSPLIKNGTFGGLLVKNNVIGYASAMGIEVPDCETKSKFLGDLAGQPVDDRFVTDWPTNRIVFDNNCICNEQVPDEVRASDYPLERTSTDLAFADPLRGDLTATTTAVPMSVDLVLPSGRSVTVTPARMGASHPREALELPVTLADMLPPLADELRDACESAHSV
ncbi:MAG: hypothetical protein U1E45_23810 [Geminicoccaceae bacterium]